MSPQSVGETNAVENASECAADRLAGVTVPIFPTCLFDPSPAGQYLGLSIVRQAARGSFSLRRVNNLGEGLDTGQIDRSTATIGAGGAAHANIRRREREQCFDRRAVEGAGKDEADVVQRGHL